MTRCRVIWAFYESPGFKDCLRHPAETKTGQNPRHESETCSLMQPLMEVMGRWRSSSHRHFRFNLSISAPPFEEEERLPLRNEWRELGFLRRLNLRASFNPSMTKAQIRSIYARFVLIRGPKFCRLNQQTWQQLDVISVIIIIGRRLKGKNFSNREGARQWFDFFHGFDFTFKSSYFKSDGKRPRGYRHQPDINRIKTLILGRLLGWCHVVVAFRGEKIYCS